MIFLNQSDLARIHNVSRKTVTKWKAAGYLVFRAGLVDLKKSEDRLKRACLGRFKAAQGNTETVTGNTLVTPGEQTNV